MLTQPLGSNESSIRFVVQLRLMLDETRLNLNIFKLNISDDKVVSTQIRYQGGEGVAQPPANLRFLNTISLKVSEEPRGATYPDFG